MEDQDVTRRSNNPQPALADDRLANWQTIIWREWCRSQDEDYAYYLYNLVRTTALGWKFVAAFALLGAISGAALGYLLGTAMAATIGNYTTTLNLSQLSPLFLGWVMSMAGGFIGVEASRGFRSWYFWWQGQPTATNVERALQWARTIRPEVEQVWAEPLKRLEQLKNGQDSPDHLIATLRSHDWRERFAARQRLIAAGGEAIETLREIAEDKTDPLWQAAMWLLSGIEHETANRYAWRIADLRCPQCLTRFEARPVTLSWGISFNYYGCRSCGQSRDYLYQPQGVVARLDAGRTVEQIQRDGLLRVNWLVRQSLIDFDRVEIVRATDEDVERFAIQMGNDTDPFRRSRYKRMVCTIGPACQLSENTLRILRRMFGRVRRLVETVNPVAIADSGTNQRRPETNSMESSITESRVREKLAG